MIHKVTYDTYPLDPDTWEVGKVVQNEDMVVYTDLEIDEIEDGIQQMLYQETGQHVQVAVKEKEIRHATLLVSEYMKRSNPGHGLNPAHSKFPEEDEQAGDGLLNPNEL